VANSPQARKRIRVSEKAREHNASLKSRMRTEIKKLKAAIEKGGENLKAAFGTAVSEIDKACAKGLIHKNKAARIKSRLNIMVKKSTDK